MGQGPLPAPGSAIARTAYMRMIRRRSNTIRLHDEIILCFREYTVCRFTRLLVWNIRISYQCLTCVVSGVDVDLICWKWNESLHPCAPLGQSRPGAEFSLPGAVAPLHHGTMTLPKARFPLPELAARVNGPS